MRCQGSYADAVKRQDQSNDIPIIIPVSLTRRREKIKKDQATADLSVVFFFVSWLWGGRPKLLYMYNHVIS